MIARSPRAPVPRAIAWSAMISKASGAISSSTSSISKRCWYCFTNAFFGSVRISSKAARSRLSTEVTIGRRPINSGIMPNFNRSSGITSANGSIFSFSLMTFSAALKPTPAFPFLDSMIFSSPAKAPPTINKTFVVSIWINS